MKQTAEPKTYQLVCLMNLNPFFPILSFDALIYWMTTCDAEQTSSSTTTPNT